MQSQKPSISRPDFLRSTAPTDITKELQKLESDISDAFQGMNISDDGIPEIHLQDLEASFYSEILEGLEGADAEGETGPQELSEDESDARSGSLSLWSLSPLSLSLRASCLPSSPDRPCAEPLTAYLIVTAGACQPGTPWTEIERGYSIPDWLCE